MPSPTDLSTSDMIAAPHDIPSERAVPARAADGGELLLIVRLGEGRFALPAGTVARILPMAAPAPHPDAPPGVIGVLPFHGALLPVVDPRPRLGLPAATPHPDQHLVAIEGGTRYLLWVDRAETIVTAPVAGQFVRVADEYLPVIVAATLAPAAHDPFGAAGWA